MTGDQLAIFGIVVAIITFVLTLLASYVFYRRGKERRHLEYELISKVQLFVRGKAAGSTEDLELRYKGRSVQNPYILLFRIMNTGNKAIQPQDYEHAVSLTVNSESTVLSAGVVKTNVPELGAKAVYAENRVTLDPVLLNPGDWIAWTVLTEGEPKSWQFKAHIAGVREIGDLRAKPSFRAITTAILTGITLMVGYFAVVFIIIDPVPPPPKPVSFGGPIADFVVPFIFVAVFITFTGYMSYWTLKMVRSHRIERKSRGVDL